MKISKYHYFWIAILLGFIPQIRQYIPDVTFGIHWIIIVLFLVITLAEDTYSNSCKLLEKKIIGTGINSTLVPKFMVNLGNNFYCISQNSYTTEIMGSNSGDRNLPLKIFHSSQIKEVEGHYILVGRKKYLDKFQLQKDWEYMIKEKLGFITEKIEFYVPITNYEIKTSKPEIKFVDDLLSEFLSTSQGEAISHNKLSDIGRTVGSYQNQANASVKDTLVTFKKPLNESNKNN